MKILNFFVIILSIIEFISPGLRKETLFSNVIGGEPGEYHLINSNKDLPAKVKQLYLFYGGFNEFFCFPWREDIQDYKFSKEPIFKFPSKVEEIYTSYKVPENIYVTPMAQCNSGSSIKMISNTSELKESFSASIKASKDIGGITYGASADFTKLNSVLNSVSSEIRLNEEVCLTEKVKRNKSSKLEFEFTDDFIDDVKKLPKQLDSELDFQSYYDFLDNYGTHFFTEIIYGAKRVEITTIKKNLMEEKNTQSFKAGITAGISANLSKGKENNESNKEEESLYTKFSMGLYNTKDSSTPIAKSDIAIPTPIKFDVENIYRIFDNPQKNRFKLSGIDTELISSDIITNYRKNMKEILTSSQKYYCNHLKQMNPDIITCEDSYKVERVVDFKILYMSSDDDQSDQCQQGTVNGAVMSRATVLEWPDSKRPQSFDLRYGFHVHSTKVYLCQLKKQIKINIGSAHSEESFISAIDPPRVVRSIKKAKQLIEDFSYTCNIDTDIKALNGGAPGYDEMILCVKKTKKVSDPGLADLAISVRDKTECKVNKDYNLTPVNEDYAPVGYETRNNYSVQGTKINYYECHCFDINRKVGAKNSYICFAPSNWNISGPDNSDNRKSVDSEFSLTRSKRITEKDMEIMNKKNNFALGKKKFVRKNKILK